MDKPKASPQDRPSAQPHYYGKTDGIHVFHATDDAHSELIGEHLQSPDDAQYKAAIQRAKDQKKAAVVIHGNPPPALMGKIDLKKTETQLKANFTKEPVSFEDLKKTYFHIDGSTRTDLQNHLQSLANVSPPLMEWGTKELMPMKKDELRSVVLHGKTLKVRKYDADLYNGWIEEPNGNNIHQFERVTLPELLTQLQSKLELYGNEKPEEAQEPKDATEPAPMNLEQAHDHYKKTFAQYGLTVPTHHQDLRALINLRLRAHAEDKLKTLRAQLKAKAMPDMGEAETPVIGDKVELPKKEVMGGILNPEQACKDCGSTDSFCECFSGLSKPQVQIDLKAGKVTILFKSEWDNESKASFLEDLKLRAGQILREKFRTHTDE